MKLSGAWLLRENTGTTGLVETARTAAAILAQHDIPHLVVGGLAVQEHGYPRVTIDVDLVVPDVLEAVELILRGKLPRHLAVAAAVQTLYHELWDALEAEP